MKTLTGACKTRGMEQGKGLALSILIHLLIIGGIISATSEIEAVPKLMVVDFNILECLVKETSVKPVEPQEVVSTPPVVTTLKKMKVATPPKKVLHKKVAPKIAKRSVKRIKIAAIKQEIIPDVQPTEEPEPVLEQIIEAKIQPLASIVEEETTMLVQNVPVLPRVVSPSKKALPTFPTPSAGKSRPNTDQATVLRYTKAHFSRIQEDIQRQMKYPRTARRMGWEGKVVVSFIICKDGTVKNLHIVESSGFKALDQNAVATIKKSAPFAIPPIPAKIIIPVVYRLS